MHFNLALYPEEEKLRAACVRLAQSNLNSIADDYILGDEAIPHISLCEFEADRAQLPAVWAAVQNLHNSLIMVEFSHIYIKPGSKGHQGKAWVGLAVVPNAVLFNFQRDVYDKLIEFGIESKTSPATYFPHLTFARCKGKEDIVISDMPPDWLWSERHACDLSLGRSNENGLYRERLFPAVR